MAQIAKIKRNVVAKQIYILGVDELMRIDFIYD